MNSPVRLGVSPSASTPTGFYSRGFEALFTQAQIPGCSVCLAPQLFPLVYLHANLGPPSLPATTLPTSSSSLHLADLVLQPLPCHTSSPPRMPISAPPTGLDVCFFFNSLVVRLPYSSIFWQFWLFFCFYISCCPSFGCVRRQSVSTYASILARSLDVFFGKNIYINLWPIFKSDFLF